MDEITLTIPRERPFYPVARLVLGGLATRLDLTVETLEDLQIALDSLLEHADSEADVTIAIRIAGDAIETRVGPFEDDSLRRELESGAGGPVGLRGVLTTVVDNVDVERDRGDWVRLTKSVREPQASS